MLMPPTVVSADTLEIVHQRMDFEQMFERVINQLTAIAAIFVVALTGPAVAQVSIDLELSGEIDAVTFSLEDLDALDQTTIETSTIWTDGVNSFSGVSLKTLLEANNATGATIKMIALNDYSVSMTIAELEDNAPIIASRMNGETMSVRDKGPYWIIFPYDSKSKYQSEIVYSRSIWQLNRLTVLE